MSATFHCKIFWHLNTKLLTSTKPEGHMIFLSPLNNISDFFQLFNVSFDAPNLHQLNKAYYHLFESLKLYFFIGQKYIDKLHPQKHNIEHVISG